MVEGEGESHDYSRAIEVAEGIFWVGFYDSPSGLHCNPYLIKEGEQAVVIDGGSRPDFPTVMMKILQTGIHPSSIEALIYQHYDPDLVGSISNFSDIIARDDLKVISDSRNNMFIRHYTDSLTLSSLDGMDHEFTFSSGRTLRFINTPYSHSAGSFVTFDIQTGVLFSSDLFGSYGTQWQPFLELRPECHTCPTPAKCPYGSPYCPLPDIFRFHKHIMTSEKALRLALRIIADLSVEIVAPQHGSVIRNSHDIGFISERLLSLDGVGIDGIISKGPSSPVPEKE